MSLANVGLKSLSPGAKISGAVQLTEALDMEKTSNMMTFSPKSVRRARGVFSSPIKMFAWGLSGQLASLLARRELTPRRFPCI